jgi:hypothetical protein
MDSKDKMPWIPPAGLFRMIKGIRGFFRKMDTAFMPSSVAVFEKAQEIWIAKALGVACELNLADILRSGPKKIQDIAAITNTHSQSLYRLMRALSGEGIFKELPGRIFMNTKLSEALTNEPGSMKFMIQHQMNETNWNIIGKLNYSIKTGENAAQQVLGTNIFDHLSKNPGKNELYNKAMTNTSDLSSTAILSAYSFQNLKKIVDIGGGEGHLLASILLKHKKAEGILFDFEHVVATASNTFERTGTANRVQIMGGNFFVTIPAGGDAYIMKNILHAFDDPTCTGLLKNICKAMNPGAKLLVIETVISENNKPEFGKLFDLQMLLGTDGGKERTRPEFDDILMQSGFKLKRVVQTVSPFSIVEAEKAF